MKYSLYENRRLGSTEYLLLALIAKAGVTSLYDFRQRAGLEPGGIRIPLQTLEAQKLIDRSESATRQRREISLTEAGVQLLHTNWRECLGNYPDADSALRAACVGLLMGDTIRVYDYLKQQSERFEQMAIEKNEDADSAEKMERTRKDPLSSYLWMRLQSLGKRRQMESEVLHSAAIFLKMKYSSPHGDLMS